MVRDKRRSQQRAWASGTLHSDTFVNFDPLPHTGCATRVKMEGDTKKLLDRVQALHGDGEQPRGEAPAASHIHTHLGGIGGTLQQVPPEETLPTCDKDDLLKDIGCIKKYTFEEEGRTWGTLVPECSFYPDRGEGLRHLSMTGASYCTAQHSSSVCANASRARSSSSIERVKKRWFSSSSSDGESERQQ